MMDAKEAILRIKEHNRIHQMIEPPAVYIMEALNMAVAALEKQIPKKIKIIGGYDLCPMCNYNYGGDKTRKMLFHWDQPFCKRCGQRLDWEVNDAEIH